MLELITNPEATNKVQISITKEGIESFCQVLTNLQNGIAMSFDDVILTYSDPSSQGTSPTIAGDTTALFSFQALDYLVVELPVLTGTRHDFFDPLLRHLEAFFPSLYKETLSKAINASNIISLFDKRTIIIFQFKNRELETVSTVPYHAGVDEYIENVSLRKSFLSSLQQEGLLGLFSKDSKVATALANLRTGYYSYYNYNNYYNNNKASFFVKKNYFRLNSLEFNEGMVSLAIRRRTLTGSYNSNFGYVHLISAILNPSCVSIVPEQKHLGMSILTASASSLSLTKQSYPVVVEDESLPSYAESNTIFIELSDKDAEFLAAVKAVDSSLVYTKHKLLLVDGAAKEVRNCTAVYNASRSLKIVMREEKKKLSDDEAYKSRIMRDYLSYAISLVAIPIFQKEFVIPECLQKSFVFKMACFHSIWYVQPYRSQPRLSGSYAHTFQTARAAQADGWTVPEIPKSIPVNTKAVTSFVKDFKSKELASSTQTRSSVFTRQFIEPFVEKSTNSYSVPKETCLFGWMFNIDNPNHGHHSYQCMDSYLVRATAAGSYFHRGCGLISDKTFGIQAIMGNVFTTTDFNKGQSFECSIVNPKHTIPEDLRVQYISAVLDIYSANFVPSDTVEKAIQSYGSVAFNYELARVNQLLFLSEESLNIFKALYSCETFEDLSICLDLCMPICLDILETLDYSSELKAHVRNMLNYFWNTTTAIAEELEKV